MNPVAEFLKNLHGVDISQEVSEGIYNSCKAEGLDGDQILMVVTLLGDFVSAPPKAEDLTKEIEDLLGLTYDKASSLADKLVGVSAVTKNKASGETKNPEETYPLRPSFAKDNQSLEFLRTGKLTKSATPPETLMPTPNLPVQQSEGPIKVAIVNFTPSTTSQITSKPIEQITKPTIPVPAATTPVPISTPPPVTRSQEPQISTPQQEVKKPEAGAEPKNDAPFIMHKEEEVQVGKEASSPYSVQRPTFYKPVLSEEYKTVLGGNRTARVEIGNEEEKPKPSASEVYKTTSQGPRVVHYSEFRTEVSPFGNQNQTKVTTQPTPSESTPTPVVSVKPPEVHPNNVIDLKDLPLK